MISISSWYDRFRRTAPVDALRAEIKSEFEIDVLKKPSSTVKRLKKYLPGEELDFRYREVQPVWKSAGHDSVVIRSQ